MKRANWGWLETERVARENLILILSGLILLVILIGILVYEPAARTQVTRFEQAWRSIDESEISDFRRESIAQVLEQPLPISPNRGKPISLPYLRRSEKTFYEIGRQTVSRVVVNLGYQVPQDWSNSEPLMVYAPRLNGLTWQVRVDGEPIGDNLDDWRMTWNTPVAARLLPGHFQPGQMLDIQLILVFHPEVGYSVSRITVGPGSIVARTLATREFFQVSMPLVCNIALLLIAGFFFSFWLSRRKETAHLLLALAAVAWCITNLQYIVPRFDDQVVDGLYSAIVNISLSWLMWLVYLFVLRFDDRRAYLCERGLRLFVVGMTLFDIPMSGLLFESSLLISLLNAVVAAGVTTVIISRAIAGGTIELRVIALTLVIALLAGLHDVALISQFVNSESIYLLPYSGILIFGGFLYAIHRRYVRAIEDHEASQLILAHRLKEQEKELKANYLRLRELERKETLSIERQRLMSDMHDGIGSSLLTALAAVEQKTLPQSALTEILHSCIDDLRLVIDSLDPDENDLVSLLANIRHRHHQRVLPSELNIEWDIDDTPPSNRFQPSEALHLMRIIQEALNNILKHASAKQVKVTTRSNTDGIDVVITDDGRGFDPHSVTHGRGLRSMQRRSRQLGGALELVTAPGEGTSLILSLPVSHS
jgi:signal transduction histidine kinase